MKFPYLLLAEASTHAEPQWYQIATGILAVPAAIIGLVYAYALLKKTRIESQKLDVERQKLALDAKKVVLESQKLEIEIREKLNTESLTTTRLDASLKAINSAFQTQQIGLLLLRFVVLYLALQLWKLTSDLYEFAILGVAYTVGFDGLGNHWWLNVVIFSIMKLPEALYWCILLALGWPLFRDANGMLGLKLSDFFLVRTRTANSQTDEKRSES